MNSWTYHRWTIPMGLSGAHQSSLWPGCDHALAQANPDGDAIWESVWNPNPKARFSLFLLGGEDKHVEKSWMQWGHFSNAPEILVECSGAFFHSVKSSQLCMISCVWSVASCDCDVSLQRGICYMLIYECKDLAKMIFFQSLEITINHYKSP